MTIVMIRQPFSQGGYIFVIRRFFSQAWLNAKVHNGGLNLTEFLAYRVGISITTLLLYVLIAQFTTGGTVDLTAWVIGNAFALCIAECVFRLGSTFSFERISGRLRVIIASPTHKLAVVMYNGVASIVISVITISVSFVIGGLLFNVNFGEIHMGMLVTSILVAAFTCVGFGLLLSVFTLITDSMHLVLNAVGSTIIIFSGANFPVNQLPVFVQWVANFLPLYRSVAAANMSMGGSLSQEFGRLIGGEFILGMIFYLLAFALIKVMERISIKRATLELF